jgi:rubrerythrin
MRNVHFNLDEIFDMAERIERNGFTFYTHLAKHAQDAELKRMFDELAEMEAQHERTFATMRKALAEGAPSAPAYDPASQADDYLWAWSDSHVFKVADDPLAGLTGGEKPIEIMEVAIGREKDSIVFYQGLLGSLSSEKDLEAVHGIISEEMHHIALLTGMIRLLESNC